MNRHQTLRHSRTQTATTLDRPAQKSKTRRRWLGFLAILALVTTSAVLAYPPDPWATYYHYNWQPSDDRPIKIAGSNATSCGVISNGSVCAEFRNYLTGHVAGMCCINSGDLYSTDPTDCLVGATYQRDTVPDE